MNIADRLGQRIYYGWVMVIALSITEMTSWGILYYTFSVYIAPMQAEFGWSRGEMTGAFSLALLVAGLIGIPIGRIIDRHGARALMTAGSALGVIMVLLWSRVQTLPAFYGVWVGIGLSMGAVLYEPTFSVIATWFYRYRGRALGILTTIGGLASVIYIPLANALSEHLGWRSGLVVLAIMLGIITIPLHLLILRRKPSDLGLMPDGESPIPLVPRPEEQSTSLGGALRDSTFWWLSAAFALLTFASVGILVHLVSLLREWGYDATFAASIAGLTGLLSLPGRAVFTSLGDRFSRRTVTAVIFVCHPLAFLAILALPGIAGVYVFILFYGIAFGAVPAARAGLLAEFYGARDYGSLNSVVALLITSARAAAPVTIGLLHDWSGGYQAVLWVLLVVSLAGLILVPLLRKQ